MEIILGVFLGLFIELAYDKLFGGASLIGDLLGWLKNR